MYFQICGRYRDEAIGEEKCDTMNHVKQISCNKMLQTMPQHLERLLTCGIKVIWPKLGGFFFSIHYSLGQASCRGSCKPVSRDVARGSAIPFKNK